MGFVAIEDEPALAALVERVERGETVEITRGGTAVARMQASITGDRMIAPERLARMRELRRDLRLGDIDVRAAIDEGRE